MLKTNTFKEQKLFFLNSDNFWKTFFYLFKKFCSDLISTSFILRSLLHPFCFVEDNVLSSHVVTMHAMSRLPDIDFLQALP